MGYYSEVAICMAFEDDAKRDAFYETLVLRDDDVGEVMRRSCKKGDVKEWLCYHDDSIKWYESHPTRQAFEDTILPLVVECGGAWHMMRVGEEHSDLETDECAADGGNVEVPYHAFGLVRRIEWY